tara:strand:+ start:1348 stop:1623 length:276 start_codon:yes stop_codon:yes gene_type:complete
MTKRTLSKLKKHLNKEQDNIKFPITGISIIAKIIEVQNKKFLEKISKKKIYDPDEKEYFIDQFNKVSYHIPEKSENMRQEKLQKQLQQLIK